MSYHGTSKGPGEIAAQFMTDDGSRTESLDRARLCAALTKPGVLPPRDQDSDSKLPESYQSIGAWGVTNFVGAMHSATFPAGLPWFMFTLAPEIEFNPTISNETKQDFLNDMFAFQVSIQAMLDSSHLDDQENGNKRAAAFFSRQYASLTQLAITGDTLEQVMDDYRIKVFRRDKYVTKRDSCGDILYHIILEECDPLDCMTDVQIQNAHLDKAQLKEKPVCERLMPMHTMVEWQPWTRTWVIRQEVNGFVCNTSQESVTPYLCTPYELVAGENYGRGFVEQSLGNLRSLNNLKKRMLEFAAMCSKFHIMPDQNCMIDRNDFKADSGTIIEGGRVGAGALQDVALFKVDKYPDFKVVESTIAQISGELARAMQIESEITPAKERTTAYQVQRVQAQLQSATGGMFSTIQDEKHIPLIRRLVHMARRDRVLQKWPDRSVRIDVLTGLAAVSKQAKLGNVLGALDVLARVNPNIVQRFNDQVLIDTIMRYSNIHEPGLVRSDKEMAAEQQKAIAANIQNAAGEKAVDVAGNIAEASLTQAATGVAA